MDSGIVHEEIVRGVARGVRPWADLELLGVRVTRERAEDGRWGWYIREEHIMDLNARPEDVAEGFLRFHCDGEQLREWAVSVLALLDFDQFEDHHVGELLLDALWDASFEATVEAEAMDEAKRLLPEGYFSSDS